MRTRTADQEPQLAEVVGGPQRPREIIIDGAVAYWLEDADGTCLGPESNRTLAPFAQALELVDSGTPSDGLAVWARLSDGTRFLVAADLLLVDAAEAAAGLPARPRGWACGQLARGITSRASEILEHMLSLGDDGHEIRVRGAAAYWLEDVSGRRLGLESDRTLAPFASALALVEAGTSAEDLVVWSRLADGERYRVTGGINLLDAAEAAAGIPPMPRGPMPPRVRREIEQGLRDSDGYLIGSRRP